jgi:long-chain fatty acid transport protein
VSIKASCIAAVGAALLVIYPAGSARAGGFDELPDQGAQALGRGGAFTAKADDTTAMYWNVAGIARQRGTKLAINSNIHFNKFYFQRAGTYADNGTDPATPWGGKPYPLVEDKNTNFVLPMLTATSDLGLSERLTFGVGVWGPAATGRTFPVGIGGKPAPSRYDFVQSNSLVMFPTLGAAYRVTKDIDIGLAGHLVMAEFNELSISYADIGACKSAEDFRCDAEGSLKAKGMSGAGSIGVLARVVPSVQLGAQFRTPASVKAEGTVTSKLPTGAALPDAPASVTLDLPWMMRAGVRYIGLNNKKAFEQYDVEANATYEAWSSAQGEGPTVVTSDLTGASKDPTRITSVHRWKDTISVRVGGAYNIAFGEKEDGTNDGVMSIRAGAFYDSPTTDNAYTRLDANTLAKVAGTAGIGFKTRSISVNFAYAAVASMSRIVEDGDVRPSNGAKGGAPIDAQGKPLPAINNGEYRAFSHILSFGVEVNFESLFFKPRAQTYGNPAYEPVPQQGSHPATEDEEAKRAKEKTLAQADEPTVAPSSSSSSSSTATATAEARADKPTDVWFSGQQTDDASKKDHVEAATEPPAKQQQQDDAKPAPIAKVSKKKKGKRAK